MLLTLSGWPWTSSPHKRRRLGEEGRKGAKFKETKEEVNDVVDDLRVNADLPHAHLECPGVACDDQQMDALQHYRDGAMAHAWASMWVVGQ